MVVLLSSRLTVVVSAYMLNFELSMSYNDVR